MGSVLLTLPPPQGGSRSIVENWIPGAAPEPMLMSVVVCSTLLQWICPLTSCGWAVAYFNSSFKMMKEFS